METERFVVTQQVVGRTLYWGVFDRHTTTFTPCTTRPAAVHAAEQARITARLKA